jgi:hypothetical protein
MEKSFNDKLADLIFEHFGGKAHKSAEASAEVIQSLSSMIGKQIAMQCHGSAEHMSLFLEMANAHMFETAASFSDLGKTLGDKKLWTGPGGTIDSRNIKPPKGWEGDSDDEILF